MIKKKEDNFKTHTILQPKDCDCKPDRYCNICDGGLTFCIECKGGEQQLLDESCDERKTLK